MEALAISPAFGSEGIPIVFACDENYTVLGSVVIENILAYASPERKYDILFLTLGVAAEVMAALTAQATGHANVSLRFFDLSDTVAPYRLEELPTVRRFPPAVMLPVFIPLVCRRYARVLALDVDIALMGDVGELFDIDLGEALIGAVADFECTMETVLHPKQFPPYRAYIPKRLGVKLLEFFNSGILSFNIEQIVSEDRLRDFTAAVPVIFRLPDQDVLNHACRGRVKFLPPVWNVQGFAYSSPKFKKLPEETQRLFYAIRDKTRIMHYTFALKPWFWPDCGFWWRFARQSPFHDSIVKDYLENEAINPFLKKRRRPKGFASLTLEGKKPE